MFHSIARGVIASGMEQAETETSGAQLVTIDRPINIPLHVGSQLHPLAALPQGPDTGPYQNDEHSRGNCNN